MSCVASPATPMALACNIASRSVKVSEGHGRFFQCSCQTRRFCQTSCQTRRREAKAEFNLRRFENSEHTDGTTQLKQTTAAGRDVLVVAGARAEEVAVLVIASTEA